ncbi:MAG: chorismate mutase [Lachnospiraceae bacterium]|nr:chorismate mutase [Lachnospiraceae bacterium]
MNELQTIREKIDEADREMVALFEKRMQLAEEVAEYKLKNDIAVLDPAREEEKLASVEALAHTPYGKKGVRELFTQIMSLSRKRQYQLRAERNNTETMAFREIESLKKEGIRTVFQGEEGAYAQAALYAFFGPETPCYHVETWRDALEEICSGRADYAVLPFENSSAGYVSENYDLISEYDVAIVGEQIIPIDHCLLAKEEISPEEINQVYSHPQALLQCSRFLEQYRNMERISLKNTAAAAKKISEEDNVFQAAIASALTADIYGLKKIRIGIQNNESNSTRFFVVSKDKVFVKDADKITVSFEIRHEAGSLYRTLSHFIYNDLNLNRIESRPIQGRNWEYRFFLDIDGNFNESAVQNALRGLAAETNQCKVWGNYRVSVEKKERL